MRPHIFQNALTVFSMLVMGSILMAGCGHRTLKYEAIAIDHLTATKKSMGSVSVQAVGKQADKPKDDPLNIFGSYGVESAAFEKAIKTSLSQYARFESIASATASDYFLSVTLLYVSHHGRKANLYGSSSSKWILTDKKHSKVLFDEFITTSSVDDQPPVDTHKPESVVRKAIRENISEGLRALGRLDLDDDK